MTLRVGEQSVTEKITDAQTEYLAAVENYKDQKWALQQWDRYEHPELTDAERLDQRDQLVYLKNEALAALNEAGQLLAWMTKELGIVAEHSPHRQGRQGRQ
jgi:hypothetical protein